MKNLQWIHKKQKERNRSILVKKFIKPQGKKQKEEEMNRKELQKQVENKDENGYKYIYMNN